MLPGWHARTIAAAALKIHGRPAAMAHLRTRSSHRRSPRPLPTTPAQPRYQRQAEMAQGGRGGRRGPDLVPCHNPKQAQAPGRRCCGSGSAAAGAVGGLDGGGGEHAWTLRTHELRNRRKADVGRLLSFTVTGRLDPLAESQPSTQAARGKYVISSKEVNSRRRQLQNLESSRINQSPTHRVPSVLPPFFIARGRRKGTKRRSFSQGFYPVRGRRLRAP